MISVCSVIRFLQSCHAKKVVTICDCLRFHTFTHSPMHSSGGRALANSSKSIFFSLFRERRGRSLRLARRLGSSFFQSFSSALN